MKKFLFVLAIGAFAACNNSGGAEAPKTDSTVTHDSTVVTHDSVKTDTTSKMMADTTKKDTTTKK